MLKTNGEHVTLLPGSENAFFHVSDAGLDKVLLIAEAVDGFVKRVNFSLCLNARKFDYMFSFFTVVMMHGQSRWNGFAKRSCDK